MKTYEDAIEVIAEMLGDHAYHNIMGGSMNFPFHGVPVGACASCIALVYDKGNDEVHSTLREAAQRRYDERMGRK